MIFLVASHFFHLTTRRLVIARLGIVISPAISPCGVMCDAIVIVVLSSLITNPVVLHIMLFAFSF